MNGAEAVAVLEGIGAHLVLRPDGMIDVTAPEVPELDALLGELAADKPAAVAVLRARPPAHPCVDCQAETEPEDLLCPACWEKRLARMPLDVAERRRRLDRVRREKRAGLIATLPHTALMATGPARGIPPGGAA